MPAAQYTVIIDVFYDGYEPATNQQWVDAVREGIQLYGAPVAESDLGTDGRIMTDIHGPDVLCTPAKEKE